jgi:hypothetical protein
MNPPLKTTAPSTVTSTKTPLNSWNTNSPLSKKRVTFNDAIWVMPLHSTSDEEAKLIWYGASELIAFRREGREVALSFRKGAVPASPGQYRGFEGTAPNRQLQRILSIRCTLSAHRKGMSLEDTATVAQKCNEWSNQLAFVQACHDFADVYQPQMTCMIPAITSMPDPQFPSALMRNDPEKRRTSLEGDESGRRVRHRVCQTACFQ